MENTVLIVEDEQDCVELLRYHLRKNNYRAVIARTGEEAIETAQCHELDAVLLDIMLPELDGWEVCRLLRESSKGKTLPIIMLSALSDEEARVKGLSLGADDYVSKPYVMKELLLKLHKQIDRHRVMQRLKNREREQDSALRYLVHEMRNAVTAIGGYSAMALRKDDPRDCLRPINSAALHAESVLRDASLLSQLEQRCVELKPETIDLVVTAEDAVDMLHDSAEKRRIETTVMASVPVLARANKTAIRQVLLNLLSNAVKYNREGGRIWIYFDESGDTAEVSIRDEGIGIDRNEMHKIFDKFYRAGDSEQVSGAGLGLYIVRLLVDAMNGAVTLNSDRGVGSTFTVSLPKAP